MMIEYSASALGADSLLAALRTVDLALVGNEHRPDGSPCTQEERELWQLGCFKTAQLPTLQVRMGNSALDRMSDAKDRFVFTPAGRPRSIKLLWHQLPKWIRRKLSGKHLLLDLATLSGSSILQLHAAAVRSRCVRFSYIYTTPNIYPQLKDTNEITPVATRSIKQPYGYRSFGQEHGPFGKRRHIIVLGFDRHRPNKFIEHYQWPTDEVHVILGSPAYVQDGEEQARLSLGPVFNELERLGQVHIANPKLLQPTAIEQSVVSVLQRLAVGVDHLDIVPLGPKPMLLGCILFWHGLSETQQERTRLLYDFPVSRQERSTGVGVTWWYPDLVMPENPSDSLRGASF